jgi:hypothetical protein
MNPLAETARRRIGRSVKVTRRHNLTRLRDYIAFQEQLSALSAARPHRDNVGPTPPSQPGEVTQTGG